MDESYAFDMGGVEIVMMYLMFIVNIMYREVKSETEDFGNKVVSNYVMVFMFNYVILF